MFVRYGTSGDPRVFQVPPKPAWPSRYRRVRMKLPFSPYRVPPTGTTFNFDVEEDVDSGFLTSVSSGSIDVVCLHWVTRFLRIGDIAAVYRHYRCPLVWSVLDQAPVTGGCHYTLGCDRFTHQCGRCPQLGSTVEHDLSRKIWLRKRDHLTRLPLTFVAPTSMAAEWVRQSSLFSTNRVELIPLGLDTEIFRPIDPPAAREALGLPPDAAVVLAGSSDLTNVRKGADHLVAAFRDLASPGGLDSRMRERLFILVVGDEGESLLRRLPFPGKSLGRLNDDLAVALAYQAADIFVCPSVVDAGPMMIPESMLCGTPVVAFHVGSALDLVRTMETGYLAAHADGESLAQGIRKLLESGRLLDMRRICVERAREAHAAPRAADRHIALYRSLLASERRSDANDDVPGRDVISRS